MIVKSVLSGLAEQGARKTKEHMERAPAQEIQDRDSRIIPPPALSSLRETPSTSIRQRSCNLEAL